MVAKRFQLILLSAGIAMILHTVEEYFTKLYNVDPFIVFSARYFKVDPVSVYLVIQALALLLIFAISFLSSNNKANKPLIIILGLIFVGELSHLYSSIKIKGYYPGLYTGIILVIIGIFYWKELIKNWQHIYESN